MVTAELAVAILGALLFLILLCWGIYLVLVQVILIDTASAVARQAARGDAAGVAAAKRLAPACAAISISRGELTTVTVRCSASPLAAGLPRVPLSARAEIVTEPGVGR